ncbi:MAG TPA: chemotaxis protein CheB [Luteimonas sp.]|nr:chemotaxis protein CheB [Luteimonas sp.]
MAEPATRVALLARPGNACDRLQAALREAGADIVLVADPNQIDAGGVRTAGAQAILIALEPSIEDALDRFDAVLGDPAITVIFDEAELAAKREGWDAARWVRHLAAKLNRHGDVLPPGTESEPAFDLQPAPLDLYQRPESDWAIGSFDGEAMSQAATELRDFAPDAVLDLDQLLREAIPAEPVQPEADDAVVTDRFRRDMDDISVRTSALELKLDTRGPAGEQPGAVVVLAGVGGPDAVRQFLAAIPPGFPRPILIRQRLDGGRHDRLVRQMQRATGMPVELAQAGEAMLPGCVYILPDGITTALCDGKTRFETTESPVPALAGLSAPDSAILMLSGGDPAMVDEVMSQSWNGALVAGQTPDECFDGTASAALIARGGESGAPKDLAKRLSTRWLSLKD